MAASIGPFGLTRWLPGEDFLDLSSARTHCKYDGPAIEFLPGGGDQSEDLGIRYRNV